MKKLLSCCEGGQLKENNVKETSPAVEAKRFSTIVTKATLILVSLAVFLPAPPAWSFAQGAGAEVPEKPIPPGLNVFNLVSDVSGTLKVVEVTPTRRRERRLKSNQFD